METTVRAKMPGLSSHLRSSPAGEGPVAGASHVPPPDGTNWPARRSEARRRLGVVPIVDERVRGDQVVGKPPADIDADDDDGPDLVAERLDRGQGASSVSRCPRETAEATREPSRGRGHPAARRHRMPSRPASGPVPERATGRASAGRRVGSCRTCVPDRGVVVGIDQSCAEPGGDPVLGRLVGAGCGSGAPSPAPRRTSGGPRRRRPRGPGDSSRRRAGGSARRAARTGAGRSGPGSWRPGRRRPGPRRRCRRPVPRAGRVAASRSPARLRSGIRAAPMIDRIAGPVVVTRLRFATEGQ